MIGYIYKTTNLINGKIYVGKHESQEHDDYIGSGYLLHKAIEKYGKNNFINEIIEECNDYNELNEREIYWINKLNSTDLSIGYNLTEGGTGGSNGAIHINKNGEERTILPEQLQAFENKGWSRGRDKEAIKNIKLSLQDPSKHQGMRGKTQSDKQKNAAREYQLKLGKKPESSCKKMSEAHSDKILINHDNKKGKYIDPKDLEYYKNLGYYRGRKKS